MGNEKNIYFFVGTTAELIKLFPIMKELNEQKLSFKIIASGQNDIEHSELLKMANVERIDVFLHKGPIKQNTASLIFWFMKTFLKSHFKLLKEFKGKRGSILVVHGDTISTMMGSVSGWIHGLKVAHVEAGLRSYNLLHPFPEEINRVISSQFARVHFCPNDWAMNNIIKAKGEKINTNANTLVDSLMLTLNFNINKNKYINAMKTEKYFVFVMHRQENLANTELINFMIKKIIDLSEIIHCAFIMHGPTKYTLNQMDLIQSIQKKRNISLLPRQPYIDFMKILEGSEFIITDGGSNQEETYYMGKPCLLLRKTTERIEGLGHNVMLSKNNPKVIEAFIANFEKYKKEWFKAKEKPSKIIANYLTNYISR